MWAKHLGRLKEQDDLIELLRMWMLEPEHDMVLTVHEALTQMERMIHDHIQSPADSRLSHLVPHIGSLHLDLKLVEALEELEQRTALTQRRYIPPTFSEFRQLFNYATVHAVASTVKFITFDADDTLYKPGHCMQKTDWIVEALLALLQCGMTISIVTAAGYPRQPDKYEARMEGLLATMRDRKLPEEQRKRFLVMGGQCNYLCRVTEDYHLEDVPREEWASEALNWDPAAVESLLDKAEATLREATSRLRLEVTVIRKERTVGCINTKPDRIPYESLEDVTLCIQHELKDSPVPCCAFNGGTDVFVDVGDKCLGVRALQSYLGFTSNQTLHFGDGFFRTGNDVRVRDVAHTMWVSNPEETAQLLHILLKDLTYTMPSPVTRPTESPAVWTVAGQTAELGDLSLGTPQPK
mmetsp:Transcript_15315/g.36149  ORF Transcript_15315/g.36149 Transcript_15315/m.36149 type:complete len:410 (+) Transcript_15315:18-1247(+)